MRTKSGDNGGSEERKQETSNGVPRRKFLKGLAAAGAAGAVLGYLAPHVQAAPSTELVLQDDFIQMKALAADPAPVPQGGLWYRSDQAAFFGSPDGAGGVVPIIFSAGVSNLGNTSGDTKVQPGQLVLQGGNNITLSEITGAISKMTVIISAGAGGGGGAALSAGTQSVSTGTVLFADSNGLSFGMSGSSRITASYTVPTETPFGISAGTQSVSTGTVLFADSNGLTFGMSGSSRVTGSYSQETTPPIGTAVKPVQSSGSTGTITRFAPEDHAHQGLAGWDVNGIASTFFGTQQLSAGAMISLATGGNTSRGSAQIIDLWSSATTASQVTTGNIVGAMASRVALEGHQHAGVHGLILSGTASTFLGDMTLNSGNMISFATAGNSTAGSFSIINLWSSATTVSSVATANAIGAMASRVALEGHQHGGVPTVSVIGNTSGSTTQGNMSLILAGGPNVTLSGSTVAGAMTISISAPAPGAAAVQLGMSNIGNTAGTTGTVNSRMLVVGGPNITVSQSIAGQNATLSISGAAAGGGATGSMMRVFEWMGEDGIITNTQWPGNASVAIWPYDIDGNYTFSQFVLSVSMSISSSSNSSHGGTLSIGVGFYTKNASTLSLATSGLGTYAWTNTSSDSINSLTGLRQVTGSFAAMNLTPGDYWMAFWSRTSTVNANWFTAQNVIHVTSNSGIVHQGNLMAAVGAASFQPGIPGMGTYSATSAALPVSIAFSHITGSIRWQYRPFISFRNFGDGG